jgi:hypothetical protein
MADNEKNGWRSGRILRASLAALAILLLAFFLPPLISINHYKAQITHLISQSFGRPVRVSSVQARLLPRPGFVLYDLSVAEDPAYGAEPVLHAGKVTASIRLFSLFTGRLEIGTISVDEASVNLVRAAPGRWNIDPLFRTAAHTTESGAVGRRARLPYLQATDSRIDFKNGVEKLPFSIVNADLSMWQEDSGEWRVRLRGQPARTDVSLFLEDTGVVRLEASIKRGSALGDSPVHLDVDWREAQLGQLARLITSSDSGWRGDLTGELHLDGTADAAQISTRLRASGVHRAEFVPASPLDFDARCNFVYHFAKRSFQNLGCESPLGSGRVHLTGEQSGPDSPPRVTVELDRIPVSAGVNFLRTLRSGLQPDLEATGTISGKVAYAASAEVAPATMPANPDKRPALHPAKAARANPGPLTGELTVEDLSLSGGGLTRPIQAPKITFAPVPLVPASSHSSSVAPQPAALGGTVSIPAGGPVPLTFVMRFSRTGYQIDVHGPASIPRAREFASAVGIPASSALDSLAGDPITVDLTAAGPWIPSEQILLANVPPVDLPSAFPASSAASVTASIPASGSDTLAGTVTLHNVNWKAGFLANPLEIAEATLHLENSGLRWAPVVFTYGSVRGTASFALSPGCPPLTPTVACPVQPAPNFNLTFADLDASSVETALLGARRPHTLLSTLIERLHPSSAPAWPQAEGRVSATSLVLGPVKLQKVSAVLRTVPDGVEIATFDAGFYGGSVHLSGSLHKPASDQEKPSYSFTGDFQKLEAKSLGQLLGLRWTGGPVSGNGKIDLAGYSDADLATSAKGILHLESRYGAIVEPDSASGATSDKANSPPTALKRFDRFTADATIANRMVTLGENQVVSSGRKRSVSATVTLSDPPTVSFEEPKPATAKR